MLQSMSDWLHGLPLAWMAAVVFGVTYLVAAVIYGAVRIFATGERARSFKAVSPGLLSPLGILLGLFIAFTAVQVWGDNDRAKMLSFAKLAPFAPSQSSRLVSREL